MIKVNEGSAAHWLIRIVWVVAVVAALLYIPTRTNTSTIGDMATATQLAIAAMSLNLLLGYGGVISLGHSAFFGIGGYTTAILVSEYGWSQGWTIYVAAAIAFVVGCIVSLPALRLKGVYLALVTLALGVLFPTLVRWGKLAELTGGAQGISGIGYQETPSWYDEYFARWQFINESISLPELRGREGRAVFLYWVGIILLAVCYLVCRGIVKSRVGRSLVAIRDNETAAAVMGVSRAKTKALVFGTSAAMCAVGGCLYAIQNTLADPNLRFFTLLGSITFLLIMVLGGAATLWGPIVGAFAYVILDTRTREAGETGEGVVGWLFGWMTGSPATLILAIVLLIIVFVAPFGIVGLLKRIAAKFILIIPRPAGTAPPPVEALEEPAVAGSPI